MLTDSDKNFRIEIDLVCNVEDASRIAQQIIKTLLNVADLTDVENFTMRDSKYNTLINFYPHHNLMSQLKAYREERNKEYESNGIEPPVVMDGIPENELVKVDED
jgi:hypothetical protein